MASTNFHTQYNSGMQRDERAWQNGELTRSMTRFVIEHTNLQMESPMLLFSTLAGCHSLDICTLDPDSQDLKSVHHYIAGANNPRRTKSQPQEPLLTELGHWAAGVDRGRTPSIISRKTRSEFAKEGGGRGHGHTLERATRGFNI